ncbi:alpha-2,8-sialyltransferase 8E-like isoform X1 [Labrus mixtus]|uniref:alpha-2,8-sialyltransferase 8E-like isoform X1 n=1 Tax=Labrus mixtus TaxID=508554 RepID=UPI0029C05172|nr:alpha-2,8-sialyltransferase 8E-like isoform X1 [Labrus mixtus]XP_060885903.1 alpha-2,8-sialyltransferase 8E-like isoform X1 [Labrus mixtus]XP_060885904.1 alpha-2,8-sialyltransferase 8E-like isoform X1 [Labrus mixtus]
MKLKSLFSPVMTLLCLSSLLIWYLLDSDVDQHLPAPQRKRAPKTFDLCKECNNTIIKVMQNYSQAWKKQEDNFKKFRSQLSNSCSGFDKAILNQANTVVEPELVDKRKCSFQVSQEVFNTFTKEHPFSNKTWDTCSVVGNGGILTDSSCGERIDSAQFVMRCNLPPLGNGYEKHVGVKTDLVTANPSILREKYESLMKRRRPFVESLHIYRNSLLVFPFSRGNTAIFLRAIYSVEDFGSPIRPVFINPKYFNRLAAFWRVQGLGSAWMSTGLIMTSIALEVCENVHLYGFWPFDNHPYGLYDLTHHYYDDRKAKRFHAMPKEFGLLMQLHRKGVLKLHLGDCQRL